MSHLYIPSQTEIDHEVEQMVVKYTGDKARIERAAALLATGAVDYISNGIGWSVKSQAKPKPSDPADAEPIAYAVTSTSCGCYDFLNRVSAQGRCADEQVTVYAGCKHVWAVKLLLHIVSAKLDAAIKEPFSGVYAVETRFPGLFAIYDRLSDVCICGGKYIVKTDTYRPETSQDAADFARWLGAQPQEFFPGGLLEQILRSAPGDKLTLRADVYYGSPTQYTLSGWKYAGQPWQTVEYADRQQFTETGWAATLSATGWVQPGRPVKQNGMAYHYALERGSMDQVHNGPGAESLDMLEARRLRAMDPNRPE